MGKYSEAARHDSEKHLLDEGDDSLILVAGQEIDEDRLQIAKQSVIQSILVTINKSQGRRECSASNNFILKETRRNCEIILTTSTI